MMDSMDKVSSWTRPALSELWRVRTADLKRLHRDERGRYREAVSRELMRRSETGDVFTLKGLEWTVERKCRGGVCGVRSDGVCTLRVMDVKAREVVSWA